MSNVEWAVLKMICMGLRVRLQLHKTFSDAIQHVGGGRVKAYVTYVYCTKSMKLTCFIQLYKGMFHAQYHSKDLIYYGLFLETARFVF